MSRPGCIKVSNLGTGKMQTLVRKGDMKRQIKKSKPKLFRLVLMCLSTFSHVSCLISKYNETLNLFVKLNVQVNMYIVLLTHRV